MVKNKENQKPLVLIVDDVPKNLQVLGSILSKEEVDIAIATNGKQALERVKQRKPDLILLDVMMPELDGFETCKILKSKQETKEIPVIFLTAKAETEDVVKGFTIGAIDYVTKPFNSTELLARVNTHLELKRARDAEKKLMSELENRLFEIAEKNRKLEELDKVKNDFLGMAAHDLRNPISAINMLLSLVLDETSDNLREDQLELLEEIKHSGEFMYKLLNDLLDLTAIESGKLTLELFSQNYVEFLKHIIKLNRVLAQKKNIELDLKVEGEIGEIEFDRNKLTQVVNNFLSNAIKFSHSDTKVTVVVKKEENHIITKIIDQGQGIPEKELPEIFKEFHKTSVSSTAGEKSTGLGLAITKKIINGHKGSVAVESEVGKGSTFYFTLPQQ